MNSYGYRSVYHLTFFHYTERANVTGELQADFSHGMEGCLVVAKVSTSTYKQGVLSEETVGKSTVT